MSSLKVRPPAMLQVAATLLLGGLLGACGPASTASPSTGAPTSIATESTAGSAQASVGPPSGELTLVGDAGLAGRLTALSTTCSMPSLNGLTIRTFATPPDTTVTVIVTVGAGSVEISVRAGSGTTYVERDFSGTGVSAFDAARGGQVDSDVTPVTLPATILPGSLGAVTHIAGVIDCGNQTPGSGTITLSGDTAQGTIDGPLAPIRVQCIASAQGADISIVGVVKVGDSLAFILVNGLTDSFNVVEFAKGSGTSQFYRVAAPGVASVTTTGAHIEGDAVEVVAAGATPHTLHVSGDAICGT